MKPKKRTLLTLLVTYPDVSSGAVAAGAVRIARHLGADLHALAINVDIPNISNALSGLLMKLPELIRDAEQRSRESGAALLATMKQAATARKIAVETQVVTVAPDRFGDVAAEQARYHDMSIIGWQAGETAERMVAEGLVFGSGRPVIVVPDAVPVKGIDHIVIAWDGSRSAARAVADAQPFLETAKKITVLTVLDEKPLRERDMAEHLTGMLVKKGLPATSHAIEAEDCPIGETLQEEALVLGADLLVMGGYGHSRLRDFVLGGATDGILGDLQLPVLLSH